MILLRFVIEFILYLMIPLVLTIILESIVCLIGIDKEDKADRALWLKSNLKCNILTNPLLNMILFLISVMAYDVYSNYFTIIVLIFEVLVVIVESILHMYFTKHPIKECVIMSIACNAVSYLTGLVLF